MKKQSGSMVWQLLRRNISKWQIFGYSTANIVGLSVVVIGVLFFCDSRHSTDESDAYISNDYVVLSKKVEGVGFTPSVFSDEEISDLKSKPWIGKVGEFTSSQFAANASVNMGGRGMASYLFFESVPDEFFDVKPRDWSFSPEEGFVPIILNKDYLALYNYGFAVPQGLPQVSEEVIGAIPIRLGLRGKGMTTEYFDAAIVGFSSRLNTIAVPESFMDWANERFAPDSKPEPSRLIVEIDRLSIPQAQAYFDEHGIEISGAESGTNKISGFLGIVSAVVTTGGLVISVLACFILVLSIFLLLQKSREKLRYLMLLGYSPQSVGRYYERMVAVSNVIVTAVAIVIAFVCRQLWSTPLSDLDLGGASPLPALVVAIGYLIIITALDICIMRRHLAGIWRG